MRILIDTSEFNRIVELRKFEVLEWLLSKGCPTNDDTYLNVKDVSTLDWLISKGVPLNKSTILSKVVQITQDSTIMQWYIDNKCEVNESTINACIQNNYKNTLMWFLNHKKINVQLKKNNFLEAIKRENIDILDIFKTKNVNMDEEIEKEILKTQNKDTIRWFFQNYCT